MCLLIKLRYSGVCWLKKNIRFSLLWYTIFWLWFPHWLSSFGGSLVPRRRIYRMVLYLLRLLWLGWVCFGPSLWVWRCRKLKVFMLLYVYGLSSQRWEEQSGIVVYHLQTRCCTISYAVICHANSCMNAQFFQFVRRYPPRVAISLDLYGLTYISETTVHFHSCAFRLCAIWEGWNKWLQQSTSSLYHSCM